MTWRLKSEGLNPHCAAERPHVGSGGRVAHFIGAIAHLKRVVSSERYEEKINGEILLDFIKTHFQETFS